MSQTLPERARAGVIAPGTRLGKYEVLKRLRSGGMAEIYLARSHGAASVTQLVVIKRILPHLAEDPDFVAMFVNEAKITASLDHPNIAHVKEVGDADGSFFLALEFVHGVDLRQILREAANGEPIPLGAALGVIATCAEALHYAHERSIVHRDMSPSNVMVTYSGHVKVLDFGIAKAVLTAMTRTGTIKGKVGYMSPEQCMAEDIDRRSDVFSLGVLLYEVTVRKRLFRGDSDFAIMNQITLGRAARPTEADPQYPAELEKIVHKAIAVRREDRYQTAGEFAEAVREFAFARNKRCGPAEIGAWMHTLYPAPSEPVTDADLAAVPDVATRLIIPTRWTTPGDRRPRRGATIGVLGVVGGVALGAAVMALLQRPETPPAPGPAPTVVAPDATRAGATGGAGSELTTKDPVPPTDPSRPATPVALPAEPAPASKPSESVEQGPKPRRRRKPKKKRPKTRPASTPPPSSILPPSRRGRK